MGTSYYGPGPVDTLCAAIESCIAEWDDDPAYGSAKQKLREVERELDVLRCAPGFRQAARLSVPNQSGQEPQHETHGEY